MPQAKKIFVVDDHPIVRKGLEDLIADQRDLAFTGGTGNADEALERFDLENPDVVILDLSLDGGSGVDLIKTIRQRFPGLAVLVLTMYDEPLLIERAMRAGALGYVTKRDAGTEVVTAIRHVLDGEFYVSNHLSPKLFRRLIHGEPIDPEASIGNLSDRELQVFTLLGTGKSIRDISRELSLSSKTVETHRSHIKIKLGLTSSHELRQFAMRRAIDSERADA